MNRAHAIVAGWAMIAATIACADVRVAFYETLNAHGRVVRFEPRGQFSHVSIAVDGRWLHADSRRGVEWLTSPEAAGPVALILRDANAPDVDVRSAEKLVGLPYDPHFTWDAESSTYCAKLVGKLLGIAPTPMRFEGEGWEKIRNLPRDSLGLSADDIEEALRQRGFRPNGCALVLARP